MSYTPVGWKDYPEKTTPVSAANLDKMEKGIINNDVAITELQEMTEVQSEELEAIKGALNDISLIPCTQSEYDSMEVHEATTLYIIISEAETTE